jgi:hypothetical protein
MADSPNPVTDERAGQAEARLQQQEHMNACFRDTFGTPHGQDVLGYLMQRYHVFTTTAVNADPTAIAVHEGSRMVVLEIIRRCRAFDEAADFVAAQPKNERRGEA